MSLLMDALKRAEENRKQAGEEAGKHDRRHDDAGRERLSIEPVPADRLPELSDHFAQVDAELQATALESARARVSSTAPTPPAESAPGSRTGRRVVIAPPARRSHLVRVVAVAAAVLAAGGGYFHMRLDAIAGADSQPAVALAVPRQAAPEPARPSSSNAIPSPPSVATAGVSTPALPSSAAQEERSTPAREPAVARASTGNRAGSAESPVRIATSIPPTNLSVGKGYDALQAGDVGAARSAYADALQFDPHNADAMVGLAVIAAHDGDDERAGELYRRALEADPENAAALAALVGMRSLREPAEAESRLKVLLAAQGAESAASGAIEFALGNVYARQRRWNEAQAAYFQAYAADAGNPDYHFNLAISLDHLGQEKLAARFYRSALDSTAKRPARFDRRQAETRLDQLAK